MNIIVLNSGSNGNAVYVESPITGSAVLLDCGISRRQIEVRLKIHGKFFENIRGVFITHEHSDHVKGLPVVSKIYHTPTYLTKKTYDNLYQRQTLKNVHFMDHSEMIQIDDITVQAFPKSHDAIDAVYFLVTIGSKKMLYVTDLGTHDDTLITYLSTADVLFLESNYDNDMLWNGSYPQQLKERIDSRHGHLSNSQAMALIDLHCNGNLQTLILGHISENNNTPEIVKKEVSLLLQRKPDFSPAIHIASRYDVSDVIEIR